MEKWLMILNLGKYEKYYMVRKDKLKEVGDVANRLIDDKADVEPVKIGLKVIRTVE